MSDVLKAWFRDRLGIMIDLSPDMFGLTTKDGTLLAQLLHSYDIIDDAQLKTIIGTEDPALARVNLRHLRLWLRFIGVDCDDDTIEDISNGKGTTATRLFYKIYVSLESKDKLHFITQQKEREKYIPNSSKFDVITISERPPTPEPSDHPLAEHLIKNASVIVWHRDKFKKILERCKHAREQCLTKLSQSSSLENKISASIGETARRVRVDHVSPILKKEMKELEDFGKRHEIYGVEKYTYRDLCEEKSIGENIKPAPVDPVAAKKFVKCMKDRSRRASMIHSCKNRMGRSLTTKLWEKQIDQREKEFDSTIANKIFSQSQYEKQMITKLCEIRDQKRRFANNRRIVDKLIQEKTECENNMELAREHETIVKEGTDIEAECLRLCELHKRIGERKILNSEKKKYDICIEALNDLIDISLRAADYREANADEIPLKIWAEWKALFIKNQPISDPIEYLERLTDSEDDDNKEEILRAEKERQKVLNESDFDNYHNLGAPWAEFVPEIDPETEEILRLGNIVLGYIVHRLLKYKNSSESSPEPPPVPKVSRACILLGVLDTSVYPTIQSLLNHRGIKLIHMEDGINYCLQCYKEETKDSSCIDSNIARSENEMEVNDISSEQSPRVSKKKDINIRNENEKTAMERGKMIAYGIDEETQTPRIFPNDKISPNLSNAAYVGELINELFTSGQRIPDELNSKIIVEYIKSLIGIKGWVLMDYPNTFNQMALVETALTGSMIPLEENDSKNDDLDDGIETAKSKVGKKLAGNDNGDDSSGIEESRLVCNPVKRDISGNGFRSYMSAYIRALPKPRNMEIDESDICEILSPDATKMDIFYTNRGLARAFYYTSFDSFTLKRLCGLVIGETSSIRRIRSVELFGDGLYSLEDTKDEPSPSRAPVIKELIPDSDLTESYRGEESEYESGEERKSSSSVLGVINVEPIVPKPGEDDWDWLNISQPLTILKALGTQWEAIETIYVEKLMEIFDIKRLNYSKILPYQNNLANHMSEFVERPDATKQDMLHIFQTDYNDMENYMRDDLDVKCELHCRVTDFREELWQICDERRKQSEDERRRIIHEDWTSEEMIVLTNLYISIVQAEIDRCIDTVQLVQDYYTSMLQRPISDIRLPKYSLRRLESNSIESAASVSPLSSGKINKPATNGTSSLNNSKKKANKTFAEVATIDRGIIREQITDLMINDESEPFDVENLICREAIRTNVSFVNSVVDSLASSLFENLKKEELSLTTDDKGKAKISKTNGENLPTTNDAIMEEISRRGIDLCSEWKSALTFETSRINTRLKLLEKAAESDVIYLYETMKNCFKNMNKQINDRYNREIKSVNDMAALFCFAIEDGKSIKEELLLDGDRFIVKSNVLMYQEDLSPVNKPVELSERILPSEFRMGQLGRLMDIFRYVAPHGSLEERIFTYIIEDMISLSEIEGGMNYLPNSWYELKPDQVSDLVNDIFGDSEYVDWREFIIYGMDIRMPNEEEILDMRSEFISMDERLTETVTREEFHSVKMWFANVGLKYVDCNDDDDEDADEDNTNRYIYLHENNERDDEEMYDDESEFYYKMIKPKGDDLIEDKNKSNKNVDKRSFKCDKYSLTNSSTITSSKSSENSCSKETVRLMLAKELLCDMFVSGCDKVNYTSFILSLCKSKEPREGLGKALSLAIGKKVCTSYEYGEEYVKKLINNGEESKIDNEEYVYREKFRSKNDFEYSEEARKTVAETNDSIGGPSDTVSTGSNDIDSKKENVNRSNDMESRIEMDEMNSRSVEYKSSRSGTMIGELSMNKSSSSSSSSPGRTNESNSIAYWIPRDICLTVLIASLPWHARQPDISETKSCLRECLEKVYADIEDMEMNDERNYVLSHRFVNHPFVLNLIHSTSAFTEKNLGNVLRTFFNKLRSI